MAEIAPLLDREILQDTFGRNLLEASNTDIPNIPFVPPSTPMPMVDGQPTPSALSALRNSVLSIPSKNGMLTGGSVPRSLYEVTSSRFDVFTPDYNNEDAYAQGQGWPSKMVNGVGKGLGLAATTLLQTTLGTLNGLVRWKETGRAASFYDNDLNKWLDEVNKAAEDTLPNYYTDVEKNSSWYSPSKLVTANFFWDGIIKNLGFAAGAAGSGYLFSGALRAIPLTARLFSVGKAAEALIKTEEALLSANKAAEAYGKIRGLSDKFLGSYQVLNPAGRTLVAALSTTGEAGFEAFHNLNQFRDEKIQEWKDTHGGMDPKGADLDAINSEADGVGNSSFNLNTALLSATNYIQFPKILGSSYGVEKRLINSLKKDISKITTDATGAFVRQEAKSKTGRLLSALNVVRPYTFSASEGFEEGAQYAISVGTQDYYNKKYDGDVASFLESMAEGVTQTFGTDEGMENILIGGLSGALMLGRGKFLQSAARSKNTANAVQEFNKWRISDFTRDTIDSVTRGVVLQKERESLLRQGDILESKDKERDYIINYLTPRIKYDRYDLVLSDIDEYKKLASTEEGFAQLQSEGKALSGDNRSAYLQRLDNLAETADNINSLYQSLQLRYGGNPSYSSEIMNKMIYAATKVSDYDTRLSQLSTSLMEEEVLLTDLIKGDKVDQTLIDNVLIQVNNLDVNSDIKDEIKNNLSDYLELSLRRDKFIKEYDDIKKNPEKYKDKDTTIDVIDETPVEVKQAVPGSKKSISKELELGKEYPLADIVRREENTLQLSPKIAVLSKTLGGEFEVVLPNGETTFLSPEQFKQYNISDIPNDFPQLQTSIDDIIDEVLQRRKYKSIPKPTGNKLAYVNSLDNKKLIDDILAEINDSLEDFKKQQVEAAKLAQNQALRKELLGTADKGVQTQLSEKEYEPQAKKTNITVVTSTKATSDTLPHHIRANIFGANLDTFPNREKIRGIIVTSKNEDLILPGLTAFLKGTSDADASKIIALLMVQDGKPVGVDGKVLASPTTENTIFQVMPDPKLEWAKEYGGGTMFRKETTPEQIEYYKQQYGQWVKEILENPSLEPHIISASFGIPEYVTFIDEKGNAQRDYTARVSVEDAGLIKPSDLDEKPLIFIPTVDKNIEKGSVSFDTPLGRPFLNLPNGYVKLDNRQLTPKEAENIYDAIHQLAIEIFNIGSTKTEKSLRLYSWLRSIVYWGVPKDRQTKERKPSGYNSIFYLETDSGFKLYISGKDKVYDFTPTSIEASKAEIITLLGGMYNNINSGLTDKAELWNAPYEEITSISPSGVIESKQWKNYQTYLLSTEERPKAALPLSVQLKPIKKGETNRKGIYFTIKDTVDRFAAPPTNKPKATLTPKTAPNKVYKLNGSIEDYISPAGKTIKFSAKSLEDIKVVKGGDLDEVLAGLTAQVGIEKAKENIKAAIRNAIGPQLKAVSGMEATYTVPDDEESEFVSSLQIKQESFNIKSASGVVSSVLKYTSPFFPRETAGNTIEQAIKNIKDSLIAKNKANQLNKDQKRIFQLLTEEGEEEETEAQKRVFGKKPAQKPAKIEVTEEDETFMKLQMDDLEDETPLRAIIESEIKDFEGENWTKTEQWLKANFPNLPVYRVKNILQTTNGAQAWGMLKNGAIYVYENAEVGTIYHEVFEGVWKIFTPQNEQNSITNEFRARKGSFIDRPTGQTINYSDATDRQVKEQLAEDFRDFVLYKKSPQKPSGRNFISKLFDDIVNFIKTFFTGEKALNNTERLFQKIGTEYYKQYTPTSVFSFAKKGLIDVEQAFASSDSEFRIANISADVVNDIIQQMTYVTLTDLVRNNKSLFSLPKINKADLYIKLKADLQKTALKSRKAAEQLVKQGKFTKAQAAPIIEKSKALWKSITAEWEEIKKKHEEYLRVYSIEFDENDELALNDEDASKKGDYQEATKIDTFKKANSAIKLLLSTIPRVNSDGKLIYSSINGAKLLPTSEVFMAIMNRVYSSRNVDEMMDRLKQMSEEDNNYKTLYSRLTKNTDDLSQLPERHDAQLVAAFWRTFKKQNPDVKNVYIFENGDIEVGDSSLSSAARQISSEYSNNLIRVIKGKNPYFEYSAKERVFVGKPSSVKSIKLDSDKNRIDFLKSLGIEFKIDELVKLSGDKLETFREATSGIKRSIEKAGKIATIGRKVLDIKGRLMQLSLIRATIDNPEFDSTFFNVKGERTQSFIGTNPVSDLFDYLSQVENKQELEKTPFAYLLTDTFSQNSTIINKIFNPDTDNRISGGEVLMKADWADGTINTSNGKKKQSSKQTYKERVIQETNLNLSGYYYNLVPGDSTTEWMVYMGKAVTASSLLSGYKEVFDIFKGYFLSELSLSREERPIVEAKGRKTTDLRFLKSILGEELHNKIVKEKGSEEVVYNKYSSQINIAVQKFIEIESSKYKDTLFEYGIIEQDAEGIKTGNLALSKGETITEAVLNRELNALTASFIINNIELHKLLYSDPYQYSDELKRVKNSTSPRQAIINNSKSMNSAFNRLWNEGYDREDIGYTDMTRDYFRTATLADVVSTSDLKDYGTFEETDGGGIISMKANRWFRIKAGEWNDDEERQYKFDIAYEKQQKEISLSSEEATLLEAGNPDIKSAYTPLKPVVFGNKSNGKDYNDIVLDKFSLYPLSYRIAHLINPESNAIKHYNKMQRENIDYSVFKSGRKVGSEGTNTVYNEDGSFNQLPYTKLINIPHSIIAIQQEVPSKEDSITTRGTQPTKLATLDFMEAGVPIDFMPGKEFNERFIAWNELKNKESYNDGKNLYKEIKHNQTLLEAITEEGYRSLLNRMAIVEDEDGNFTITNTSKIAKTLEDEMLKREVNDNIKDAFEGFKEGDVVLEATPAYQQIRNILYSLASKNIIKPKISGGQKVQIPSTLLESVRAKKEKGGYSSDILRFYEDEDGKRTCEIMIGRWFDSPLSDEELLNYFNKTEAGKKVLAGVAFRIPTQKQNSIESFVIKQFLPREFGDSVVIPSALVKKVGSDFDIDKLYLYFKNVYQNAKGDLKPVPFYGYGKQAIDKFEDLFHEIKEFKIVETGEKLEKQAKLSNLFGDIALGLKEGKIADKWTPIFREWFKDELVDDRFPVQRIEEIFMSRIEGLNKSLSTLTDEDIQQILGTEMAERWYKQSLENEYIESLQTLVSHPLNFANLIKPNSAEQLKDLAKEINKKLGVDEFDYTSTGNMLSRGFMSKLRHSFVSGKYAIGIAAVNQTNHSLNQRQPIYIDNTRWDLLSIEDKYWLTGGTLNQDDIAIKFKNYNKIEINDRIVPTLSMIKNSDGENISDIIGQFIDGYVDISKGPWIMDLGAAPNVAPVWLFLTKIGVPINDIAYFMNQPIIKDYLKSIENAGYSWLFINTFVDAIKESEKYKINLSQNFDIKEIPANLKSTVGKETLSPKEREEQQFMLDEFLKYAKMANHLFLVTQGSNFDTATFNDPYLVFKKHEQLKKAQNTVISSVNDLMTNSFVGKLSNTIYNVRDAFSTVLASDKIEVRTVIENVLRPYVDLNDRDFVKLAQKAVNDLFDWAVQVDRNLNSQVKGILLSDENAAKQVSDFVTSVRTNDKHPLYNNLIIKSITPHFDSKPDRVNNLKIKNKDNKVYDQNQMIYAFAELRNHLEGQNSSLYGVLIRLAVLQSGLSNSPISFTSLLPHEDFKEIYNKTLSTLENMPNLEDFYKMNVFQRNNWNNDDLVPTLRAKWKLNKNNEWKYNNNMNFWSNKRVDRAIGKGGLPRLLKVNELSGASDNDIIVYTWETGTKAEKAELRKRADFSYIKKGLFKKVQQGDQPFTQSYTMGDKVITDYIYKPINAWGDSHSTDGNYFSANEFYATPKPSIIDNGFIKIKNEVADETIITYFTEPAPKAVDKTKGTDQIPNCV